MSMRPLARAVAVLFALAAAIPAPAGPAPDPQRLSFQGRLTDASGNPVSGSVSMTFTIYDASSGGTNLWTETQTVSVAGGIYTVYLGSVADFSGLTLDPSVGRWLGVKVGSDDEMTPRYLLTGSIYSRKALDADLLGGLGPGAFAAAAHPHDASHVTTGILGAARGGTGISGSSGANHYLRADGLGGWSSAPIQSSDLPTGSGHYLARNAPDTSVAAVDSAFLYALTNSSSVGGAGALSASTGPATAATGSFWGLKGESAVSDNTSEGNNVTNYGVQGIALSGSAGGMNTNYGVRGEAAGNTAFNYGLYGTATGTGGSAMNYGARLMATGTSAINYGLYASASGGVTNYAGYFNGDVVVLGNQSASGNGSVLGNFSVGGNVTLGNASTNTVTVTGTIQGSTPLVFEGDPDANQLTLRIAPLTTNRVITLPNATGDVITTGNLADITAVGTIGSGTWNGAAIGAGYGGTGLTSSGAAGNYLRSNGSTWTASAIQADDLPNLGASYIQNQIAVAQAASFRVSGAGIMQDLTVNGNVVLGSSWADTVSIPGTIQGGTPLRFEGATDDDCETTFVITDPTADRSIIFPNATGTVITTGNAADLSAYYLKKNSVDTSSASSAGFLYTITNTSSANGAGILSGIVSATTSASGSYYGLRGESGVGDNTSDGSPVTNYALYGYANGSTLIAGGNTTNYGLYSRAVGAEGPGGGYNYGVYGAATGAADYNYGIYGTASGGTTNWAGFFLGDVYVSGKTVFGDTVTANDHLLVGALNAAGGFLTVSVDGQPAEFDRVGSDGTLIDFERNGSSVGSISVSSGNVSYNAFSGSHYAWAGRPIESDRLVSLTGDDLPPRNPQGAERIYGIAETTRANDPRVLGSYRGRLEPAKPDEPPAENPHLVAAVGNGDVWVADDGRDIAIGDYLVSSATPGHAMRDRETHPVSHVVARAAEAVRWADVSETIGGVKRKRISVFFESFVIDRRAAQEALAAVRELKAENARLQARLEALERAAAGGSGGIRAD
jgi:hypothetical protein